MKIPVLLTVFNRKDTALKALESIRVYQPEKLYIAADGHRTHKEGEEQACADTRQAVLDAIDWPCDVRTLFREENLGCAKAMFGAISWFLEQEEWGIICEDDIVRLKNEIDSITDYSATIKKRKAELKESVDIIEQIIEDGAISDTNLRMLVDSIVISEKDKKLHIKINLNAKFERHKDCYDAEGNLTERMFIA